MIPKKMKAVVLTGVGQVELHEYDVPEIEVDEVLVQTRRTSLCTVDQRPYRGATRESFPRIGGHEGAGEVVAVGERVKNIKVGDRVAIFHSACGICPNCILGVGHCQNASRPDFNRDAKYSIESPKGLDGLFAQYVVRKERGLYKIADSVPYEHAALTEPFSDVIHSIRRSRLSLGETCVVIGAGIMGLLHTQMAKNIGARVIVSEIDATRRDNAKIAGADIVINPQEVDPVEFVMDLTNGRGVDVVFFAIAISKYFEQSYSMLCGAGRIVIYSSQHPDDPYPLKLGQIHRSEKEIIGTFSNRPVDIVLALQMMAYGKVNLDMVIAGTFPITRCKEAFDTAIVPNTYRCVIKMDEE